MLKVALLIAAGALASLALVPATGASGKNCPSAVRPDVARVTIKRLKIFDRPIRAQATECTLSWGPVWDPYYISRPGDGKTMVLDAHDVTPVPGYDTHGKHGPFYHLIKIRPGMMMKIKWHGVWRHYRFVTRPFAERQCRSKAINNKPARLDGELLCIPNNKPIKRFRTEVVYLRCCWPRYTRKDFLYERAVLVDPKP